MSKDADLFNEDHQMSDKDRLVAAFSAFVHYGRADLLTQYWSDVENKSPAFEELLEAIQYMDDGIALCNVKDFYDGLLAMEKALEKLKNDSDAVEDSLQRQFLEKFEEEFSPLVTDGKQNFLELIKWTYSKKMYQQTLTIIEAKAPDEMVHTGMLYYAKNEEDIERYKQHMFNAYKDKDNTNRASFKYPDKYFICYVNRGESVYVPDKMRSYAAKRVRMIGEDYEDTPKSYTLADNKDDLENLLYTYYTIAELRDHLNHATDSLDDWTDEQGQVIEDGLGKNNNVQVIQDTIESFLEVYEAVNAQVGGKDPTQLLLTKEELDKYIEKHLPKSYGKKLGDFTTKKIKNDPYNLEGFVEYSGGGEIVIRIAKMDQ